MAAFLGTRETLQPRSGKQHRGGGGGGGKRGRAKDGSGVPTDLADTPGVGIGGSPTEAKVDPKSIQLSESGNFVILSI